MPTFTSESSHNKKSSISQ